MASKKELKSNGMPSASIHKHKPLHSKQGKTPHKNTSPNLDRQPQKIAYSIVHNISGRIRFRIPRLANDSEYADQLKLAIESDSRITNVRINPTTASLVVNYQTSKDLDKQMRSHLVNLIQTAPKIQIPAPVTTKSIVRTSFDALINLIDGTRKINQARNAIVHRQFKKDIWERLLSGAKSVIKKLRSVVLFIVPNKKWRASHTSLQEEGLQAQTRLDKSIVST